jgi:hypothetical protein
VLRKLANMRAAKARLRLVRIAAGLLEREPKMVLWFPLELGVRDKVSGEVAWIDLRSVRDAARRLGIVLKFYQPGRTPQNRRFPQNSTISNPQTA